MDQAEQLRQIVRNKEKIKKETTERSGNSKAKIIAITSGKGGVGKTSLTVNMAAHLAKMGKKILVIDADLGLSNVEIMLGVTPSYTLRDLIKNHKTMEEIIIKGPFKIDFISGGNGFLELTELSEVEREEILVKLKMLDDLYDVIIIDTGAGISNNVIAFLMIADEIIVISTSIPTSLTDAYSIIKIINERRGLQDVGLVINRVKNIKEYEQASKVLINTTRKFLKEGINNLGYMYEDISVQNTVFKKIPFVIYYPDSKATKCVKNILEELSFETIEEDEGIINKFKSWFSLGR